MAEATVGSLLAAGTDRLREISPTARLDAELLLASVLRVERARLVIDRDASVDGEVRADFDALLARRARSEPVAYLLGHRGFRRIELAVDPRVLIPRPETELLVEVGIGLPAGASVLDVGTGSGAVALALASERPDLVVRGVDVSADVVAAARANAAALGLADRVSFAVSDLLGEAQPCDAVLANLPYVEDGAQLPVDVRGFEPGLALFGGADGLSVIRRLVASVDRGWPSLLALEIGASQGDAVASLVRDAGFADFVVLPDLAGRDRVVVGRR